MKTRPTINTISSKQREQCSKELTLQASRAPYLYKFDNPQIYQTLVVTSLSTCTSVHPYAKPNTLNKVAAGQFQVTTSWALVSSSLRSCVFFFWKFYDWIAGLKTKRSYKRQGHATSEALCWLFLSNGGKPKKWSVNI